MITLESFWTLLTGTGASLLFLAIVFRPLEMAYPAKPNQPFFRPAWLTDLAFFLGQYLLWNGIVVWLLIAFRRHMHSIIPADFQSAVAQQSWWLQGLEVIILSDFCVYWGHRWQHRLPWLWRFHSIHHTAEHLDWLAAHREHPIDTIYTMGLINLPPMLLGFPLSTLSGVIAFRGIWAIYIHSNVRLPLGPLRMLIGAPELHHWHHDRARDAGNYANISPLMDILFGTYRCPDHEPEDFGVTEAVPKSYLGQLIYPFLPKRKPALAEHREQTGALENRAHELVERSHS